MVKASPEKLVGQFYLSRDTNAVPPGWQVATQSQWTLVTHPALHVTKIVGGRGETLGWLLGTAVTESGVLARDTLLFPDVPYWEQGCDRLANGLTGRFLLILISSAGARVYPDAFTMLAAVFAPESGIVASTSSLVPVSDTTPFAMERITATNIPHTNAMYPLGLTPRRGIERVLPNHYLDLERWVLVRRWPLGHVAADLDPAEGHRLVARIAKQAMRGITNAGPVQAPLTAGRDSRLILACSREFVREMTFFTARFPSHQLTGWRDIHIARSIAARHGLAFRVLPHRRPRAEDLRDWVAKTAGETGEVTSFLAARTLKQVSPNRTTLIGWAGDVVRPLYWKDLNPDSEITLEKVLSVCYSPAIPDFIARAERWLDAVPTRNAITIMDLLVAEQRGGCWAGIIEYAEDANALARFAPLCNQEVLRALMRLPIEYRRQTIFERDVIAQTWPELLEFPFNEQVAIPPMTKSYFQLKARIKYTALRVGRLAKMTATDPGKMIGKIRSRVSR